MSTKNIPGKIEITELPSPTLSYFTLAYTLSAFFPFPSFQIPNILLYLYTAIRDGGQLYRETWNFLGFRTSGVREREVGRLSWSFQSFQEVFLDFGKQLEIFWQIS